MMLWLSLNELHIFFQYTGCLLFTLVHFRSDYLSLYSV